MAPLTTDRSIQHLKSKSLKEFTENFTCYGLCSMNPTVTVKEIVEKYLFGDMFTVDWVPGILAAYKIGSRLKRILNPKF
jgi:hypothetical protein